MVITAALAPLRAGEPAPTFKNPVVFPTTGCNPYGIADGDLNNDGYPDIAVANMGPAGAGLGGGGLCARPSGGCAFDPNSCIDGSVTVFINSGDWKPVSDGFPASGIVDLSMAGLCEGGDCTAREVAIACINGDILPDVIVTAAEGYVLVFKNTPSNPGTFQAADVYPLRVHDVLREANGLIVSDLNLDGYNDVAVAACDGPVVLTLMNDQSGGFQAPSEIDLNGVAAPAFDLVSGKFDGGVQTGPDLVVGTILDNSITIMSNDGFGNFSINTKIGPVDDPWGFEALARGRFNGDSNPDVVFTERLFDVADIFRGDGQGDFTHSRLDFNHDALDRYVLHPDDPNAFCFGVDTGQLNGGLKRDFAAAIQHRDEVSIQVGNGDGTFDRNLAVRFSVEPPAAPANEACNPIHLVIVDLDKDGQQDIVTSNRDSNNISVLINKLGLLNVGP